MVNTQTLCRINLLHQFMLLGSICEVSFFIVSSIVALCVMFEIYPDMEQKEFTEYAISRLLGKFPQLMSFGLK